MNFYDTAVNNWKAKWAFTNDSAHVQMTNNLSSQIERGEVWFTSKEIFELAPLDTYDFHVPQVTNRTSFSINIITDDIYGAAAFRILQGATQSGGGLALTCHNMDRSIATSAPISVIADNHTITYSAGGSSIFNSRLYSQGIVDANIATLENSLILDSSRGGNIFRIENIGVYTAIYTALIYFREVD